MARINFADLEFDIAQNVQYVYLYDFKYRYKGKQRLEVNFSNGEFIVPPNSTDVPMNLSIESGYVAIYDPETRTWSKKYDVWARTYYYKENGELVTDPDPDRLDEYTTSFKSFPTAIYNEELDMFIYPPNEFREMLKEPILSILAKEADEDFILGSNNVKYAVSYLLENNLKQAMLKLTFAVGNTSGEPILSVTIDTYPVEQPTTVGETAIPDPRNQQIQVDAEEIDRLLTLLQEKFAEYGEKNTAMQAEIDNMSDEEITNKQVEAIRNGDITIG